MSESRDNKPEGKDPPAAADDKRSGRVAFDSRGNSVWEWQVQTGVYSRDVNTENVRKLDLDDLSLEDTAAVRSLSEQPERSARETAAKAPSKLELEKAGGGFNPYNNSPGSAPARDVRDPYDNARLRSDALSAKRTTAAAAPRKPVNVTKQPPTELRKLSGWSKLKRVLTGKR